MLDARRSKYEKGEHPDALDPKARYELALNLNIDLYYIIVASTRDFKVVKTIKERKGCCCCYSITLIKSQIVKLPFRFHTFVGNLRCSYAIFFELV